MKHYDVLVEIQQRPRYQWVPVVANSPDDAARKAEVYAKLTLEAYNAKAKQVQLEGQEELFQENVA